MLSFEPELEQHRAVLGDERTDALIARERREVFSLYPELSVCAWAGAMLLAAAAGIVLKNNLERIGPFALAALIGAAAIACYAWVWWHRTRATFADDYILLLGALLLSADFAFIEKQFHLLDHHWPRHFLLLAVIHGVTAYAYRSRTLLSLSLAAMASWLGIERRDALDLFRRDEIQLSMRAFLCAALILVWREIHRRAGGIADFLRVFEHFAANLALWGGLVLLGDDETFTIGCAITLALAVIVMRWGFVRSSEPFVLYGFVYAVIAADAFLLDHLPEKELVLLVSMILAIPALVFLHKRFKGADA